MKLKIFIIFFLLNINLFSNFKLENWKSHSSRMNVFSSTIDKNGNIWCATDGGIFKYNINENSETVFDNINFLFSNQISFITYIQELNSIYAGSRDGILEIYDFNKWNHILDIKNQSFSNPIINDIVYYKKKLYIAGGFGLTIFDPDKQVFSESILKIGNFPINTNVNKILIDNNKIWLATDAGLAFADLNNFLPNPNNWRTYNISQGLYENKIIDLALINNELYLLSDRFILKFDGEKFIKINESLDKFLNIRSFANKLYYATIYNIFDENSLPIFDNLPSTINGFNLLNNGSNELIIITYIKNNGIILKYNNKTVKFLPNTPISNSISDIFVNSEGEVWIATGNSPASNGFSLFKNNKWHNFTTIAYKDILDNAYYKIKTDNQGNILASNWGKGLLFGKRINDTTYKFTVYNEKNSDFIGISVNPQFIVAGETQLDRKGNIWTTNLGEQSTGSSLLCFVPKNDSLQSIGYVNPRNPNQRPFISMVIDNWGTKWLGGNASIAAGLMYFNENNTLENKNDDISGVITTSNYPNLNDNFINCLAVDYSGILWIGTPKGLSAIINPNQILNNTSSNLIVRTLNKLTGEINVNDIYVDALNYKWIATTNGIWILNNDGSDTITIINSSNSPLPDNDIKSIYGNPQNGKIYISTNFGLYETNSLSIAPLPAFNIICYPQPFNPLKDAELKIDGLSDYSEIRILTTSGELIKSFNTNSRKIVWDGKDNKGNYVKSGIYLINAVSEFNKESAVQKIAIVND